MTLVAKHPFHCLIPDDLGAAAAGEVLPSHWNADHPVTGTADLAQGGTGSNLTATGGPHQVLMQTTLGGAVTVSQLAAADLSNGATGTGGVVLATNPVMQCNGGGVTILTDPAVNINNTIAFGPGTGPQGQGTQISMNRQNGTTASPTTTLNGDEIGFIQWLAWDGTRFASDYPLAVNVVATENWTVNAHGGGVGFQGNKNGQVTGQFEGIFANGLILGQGAVQGIGWGTLSALNAAGTAGPTILAKTAMTSYAAGNWGFGAVFAWANNNYIVPYSDANSRAGIAGSGTFAGGAAGKRIVGIYGDVPTGGHGPSAVCGEFYRPDSNFMVLLGGGFDVSDSTWPIAVYNTSNSTHPFTADASGNVAATNSFMCSGNGGVGYSTGAGGTVTQATSKATGVTLNKASGQITMNNAALAAGAIVSFVLTNSAIASADTLVFNHFQGGTFGAYTFGAQCTAGSATINVRNNTAGSLSEAIVLQFNLIKGATS